MKCIDIHIEAHNIDRQIIFLLNSLCVLKLFLVCFLIDLRVFKINEFEISSIFVFKILFSVIKSFVFNN